MRGSVARLLARNPGSTLLAVVARLLAAIHLDAAEGSRGGGGQPDLRRIRRAGIRCGARPGALRVLCAVSAWVSTYGLSHFPGRVSLQADGGHDLRAGLGTGARCAALPRARHLLGTADRGRTAPQGRLYWLWTAGGRRGRGP